MREHINRISEAYLVLRDSRSRKEYDLGLLRGDQ
jgi:curved DNA-binding protein CbpA